MLWPLPFIDTVQRLGLLRAPSISLASSPAHFIVAPSRRTSVGPSGSIEPRGTGGDSKNDDAQAATFRSSSTVAAGAVGLATCTAVTQSCAAASEKATRSATRERSEPSTATPKRTQGACISEQAQRDGQTAPRFRLLHAVCRRRTVHCRHRRPRNRPHSSVSIVSPLLRVLLDLNTIYFEFGDRHVGAPHNPGRFGRWRLQQDGRDAAEHNP